MPQGDVIVGGSISANSTSQTAPAPNSTANFNASGVSGGSLQVTGAFVGTLVPEGSLTGAPGDWQAAPIANLAGTPVTSITAPGFFTFNAETFVFFRLRSTAWTSGTAAVVFKASPGAGPSAGGAGGGGGAVTVADGADVTQGTTTDVAAATDTANTTIVAFWKRLLSRLTTLLPQAGGRVDVNLGAAPVTVTTQGTAAHGAADAGNPVEVGGQAIAHGTNPTAVTAGQRTLAYFNRAGVLFVVGGHPNVQTLRVNYTTAQTDTAIITVATGTKIVVTGFLVTADAGNTVNTTVRIGFGTVNTPAGAGVIGSHPGVAPGSGFGRGGGAGIIGVGADDADLRITSSVPTGGSIDVDVSFYTIES